MRRSDPQQSNELPVGRSALISRGFVFEPLDAHLDYFLLADHPLRTSPFASSNPFL